MYLMCYNNTAVCGSIGSADENKELYQMNIER